MKLNIVEHFRFVLSGRKRRIANAAFITLVVLLLCIRLYEPEYSARVKVYVPSDENSSITTTSIVSLGGSAAERDTYILEQETLLYSSQLYERVQDKIRNSSSKVDSVSSQSLVEEIMDVFQIALFGSTYVSTQNEFSDSQFLEFTDRIGFESNLSQGSFTVRFRDQDAEHAVRVIGFIAQALSELDQKLRDKERDRTIFYLEGKVEEVENKLKATHEKMSTFIRKHQYRTKPELVADRYKLFVVTQEELLQTKNQLLIEMDLEKSLRKAEDKLKNAVTRQRGRSNDILIGSVQESIARTFEVYKENVKDDEIRRELEKKLQGYYDTIDSLSPKGGQVLSAVYLEKVLADISTQIVTQKSSVAASKAKVDYLAKRLSALSKELKELPELENEMSRLLFENKQHEKVLEMVTEQYLTSLLQKDVLSSKLVAITTPAIQQTFQTGKGRLVLLALLIALTAGVTVNALYDLYKQTLLNKLQLKNLPAKNIGSFPSLKVNLSPGALRNLRDPNLQHIAYEIRRLTAGVRKSNKVPVIAMTSTEPNQGKSFTCYVLSSLLSTGDDKVLVIDADFYAPLSRLTSRINGTSNFHSLSADNFVPSPTRPISFYRLEQEDATSHVSAAVSSKISSMIAEAKKHYSYIIIDNAPLAFADTLSFLTLSDIVLFCAREKQTSVVRCAEGLERIREVVSPSTQILTLLTDCQLPGNLSVDASNLGKYYQKAS